MKFLQDGNRLDKPEHCDDDLYEEMMKCWEMNRSARPKFPELLQFYNNHYKGLMKGVSNKKHKKVLINYEMTCRNLRKN